MSDLGNLPKTRRKSGANEGIQAATTPNEVSTQDHSWGRAEVSDGKVVSIWLI